MPFMPEMFAFCGKRFPLFKSAHKTCDTVFPVRSRRVDSSVHLETRCDGRAHGGCQAGCLIFWKEEWLKRVESIESTSTSILQSSGVQRGPSRELDQGLVVGASCTEEDVQRATRVAGDMDNPDPTYVCQATRLPYASTDLSPFDIRQYLTDLSSGNVGLGQWLRGILYITYQRLINLGIGWGALLRWLYDRIQGMWGGIRYPRRLGKIPMGQPTPAVHLNLQEGELVRIKSYEKILATCNTDNRNRGMGFDAEMVPYCDGTYRVLRRVTRIINERTGKMMLMKNPCIILDNVVCQGRYSECRMFCPRAIYPYWREIWLERV
jgi:hypothetical protein